MDEIVVNEGAVLFFILVLSFIFNQALAYFGIELEDRYKKLVVFLVAVGLTAFAMVEAGLPELPDAGADPSAFSLALLGAATLNFKVAQIAYDRLWKALLNGRKKEKK